jgi:hypothetical protein
MTEQQLQSNERLLQKCAAVKMQPFLEFLKSMRDAAHLIVEIMYYAAQAGFSVLRTIVLGLFPNPTGVQEAAKKIIMYLRLFMDAVAEVVDLLYGAMFELVFGQGGTKVLIEIIHVVCKAIQFIDTFVIKKGICVFLKFISDVYKWLYDTLMLVVNIEILGAKIFWFLYPIIGNVLLIVQNVLNLIITVVCHSPPMQCEIGNYEVADNPSRGTLPVASRCWSSYTTFFGDGQSLACTAADTCKRSLTDSTLVMCGTCPLESPPNPLTFQYGCDTIIKTCTCSTPKLAPAYCYSNAECEDPGRACVFIDSELEAIEARTMCETCQTRPLCLISRGSNVGQCACGLRELEFARCRQEDVGDIVALPYSKMCVLQTDARYSASLSYSAVFAQASIGPCMDVDASTSYCMRVVDLQNSFMIVSTHTQQSRRLLLEVGSEDVLRLNASSTRHPPCQDALGSDADTYVRRDCVTRYVRSSATVAHLGLHADVARCAFCSSEDMWQMLAQDPMILAFLVVHPHKLWYALLRHTPLARVLQLGQRLQGQAQDLVIVLARTNLSDYLGVNSSASGLVLSSRNTRMLSEHAVLLLQALLRGHYATSNTSHLRLGGRLEWSWQPESNASSQRRLLSLDAISQDVEFEVSRAFATQDAYTSQIVSAFDYNFPMATDSGTRQWLESWPPTLGSARGGDGTCSPARDLVEVVYYSFGNASLAYIAREPTPKIELRQAFPRLRSASSAAAPLQRNVGADAPDTQPDPLVRGMMRLINELASALGVRDTFFFDALYSFLFEVQDNLMCDIEAVQTCSKWTVSMGNGLIVVLVLYLALVVLLTAFRLETFAVFAVPFLWLFLWRLCYGFSWTCVPLLPVCLVEDLYTTISSIFPKQILIPQALWLNTTCADQAVVRAACLKTCQDEPFAYSSLQAVLAWGLAEAGADAAQATRLVPVVLRFNTSLFLEQIMRSSKVLDDRDPGLVGSNRLCAAVNSYRLVPYLAGLAVMLTLTVLLLRIALAILFGVFTGAFAVFLPSFTR